MKINLTKREKTTIDYYDKNAEEWIEKHGGFDGTKEAMKKLFRLVPKGKVLEVGVGSGRDAKALIEHYGHENYIGVEPAGGLLKIAKAHNPDGKFLPQSIYDIDFPDGYFDTFWLNAMLIHVPKNKLVSVLKELRKSTKENTYGFVSIMEGDADLEENRPGRYYSLWSQEEFEKDLMSSGFLVFEKNRIVYEKGSPWLEYFVKTV